jgi:hypothetical protein
MMAYRDTEWGVPLHDEQRLFEFLILEGMQAGLSWSTILKRSVTPASVFPLCYTFVSAHGHGFQYPGPRPGV